MKLGVEIEAELRNRGADFVFFTDISQLSDKQNRQYPLAILFGITLSPEYIQRISRSNQIVADEFNATESKTDQLADDMADYLALKGYSAFSIRLSSKAKCETV